MQTHSYCTWQALKVIKYEGVKEVCVICSCVVNVTVQCAKRKDTQQNSCVWLCRANQDACALSIKPKLWLFSPHTLTQCLLRINAVLYTGEVQRLTSSESPVSAWHSSSHLLRLNSPPAPQTAHNLFTRRGFRRRLSGEWGDLSPNRVISQSLNEFLLFDRIRSHMWANALAAKASCQLRQTFIVVLHQRQDVAFLSPSWMRTSCRHQWMLLECVCLCVSSSLCGKNLTPIPYQQTAWHFFSLFHPFFLIMFCLLPLKQPDSPFSPNSSTDPLWPGCSVCPCILLLCLSSPHLPAFPSERACFVWRGRGKQWCL